MVLSFDALMDALPVPRTVRGQAISIENGAAIDFQQVQRRLAQAGYDRESQVEGPGQFAVRGGILDIFPITEELPVRIELWGDEVDSVRTFDVESQRSVENLEQVLVYPCEEAEKEGERGSPSWTIFPRRTRSSIWTSRCASWRRGRRWRASSWRPRPGGWRADTRSATRRCSSTMPGISQRR